MSSSLTQAVILAGGRGSRLRPLTDTIPKPMVPFHGRPFLAYLLDQVRDQGIQEVILLVGYLANQIRDYFGDGAGYGLTIRYVESPVGVETGQRLREATPLLAPHFLLMYCDNYWPMQLPPMWDAFQRSGAPALVTIYRNRDGYTRSNVRVDEQGFVRAYDPQRTASHLQGVEIGYAILDRGVLDSLPEGNVRFEHTVYPTLVSRHLLSAYQTDHRYYSVGSHQRLSQTEAFLAPQRAVILDRDGVLNRRPPRAKYVCHWDEFHWLPGAKQALRLLKEAGNRLIVVTNQPGIARGMLAEPELNEIHHQMKAELSEAGAPLEAIYFCPHGWDEGCFCRKPQPGMLFQAQQDFHLDLTRTLFIGDDERDMQAGQAAGCPTALVSEDDTSLLSVVEEYLSSARLKVSA